MKVQNVEIRRPRIEDTEELHKFFRTVITDTFIKEGIGDKVDDMEEEIRSKKANLNSDLESNGENRYFLIAYAGSEIIGSIEYGPSSELINTCTDNALKELNEVGTVFVHLEYQGIGIGSLLLRKMDTILRDKGIKEFCLDSGYVRAQTIWKKKFGAPDYFLKDYWGEGFSHMIWRLKVGDFGQS
jgi:GNAT superfamily N-acetyltransferase